MRIQRRWSSKCSAKLIDPRIVDWSPRSLTVLFPWLRNFPPHYLSTQVYIGSDDILSRGEGREEKPCDGLASHQMGNNNTPTETGPCDPQRLVSH